VGRRAAYRTAFVLCVLAVIVGSVLAWRAYPSRSSPQDVVRAYFAALERADAPTALGLGTVPVGPHAFLTSAVLAEQQRIAPMSAVVVGNVVRDGDRARIGYRYRQRLDGADQIFTGTLDLTDTASGWRLRRAAVPTRVVLSQATDRLTFAGTAVPTGRTVLFPGALPARFDNPYLRLDPATAIVQPTTGPRILVTVEPTALARSRLLRALAHTLTGCEHAVRPAASCPAATGRIVPGSLRGRLLPLASGITFGVRGAPGRVTMTGTATFVGRYGELGHDNVVHERTGRLVLPVDASAYPVAPLTVRLEPAG
jgi:hypothetical protein